MRLTEIAGQAAVIAGDFVREVQDRMHRYLKSHRRLSWRVRRANNPALQTDRPGGTVLVIREISTFWLL